MSCKIHQNHDHVHGSGCGHEAVPHRDHIDYLHDGHLHYQHGDHVDEHAVSQVPFEAQQPSITRAV
jgi:hypothetical protein